MLRDRGGESGHDGAGLLVGAELQGDRRADHRLLPLQRHRERPHPAPPVGCRLTQHPLDHRRHVGVEALVRAEEEADRLLQAERALFQDMAHRRVGGEPHRHLRAHIADVVGAGRGIGRALAVVHGRPQSDLDPWRTLQRPQHAHEGQRPVLATVVAVAGREVDHLHFLALIGADDGAQDRRVAQVGLLPLDRALDLDVPQPLDILGRVASAQQGREERIAVHPGHAGP
jgi:hypothetical protein